MSWQELLQDKSLTITTGEGTIFKPLWVNANKETRYNAKIYDFPELDGSFVPRKRKRGDRFRLELYFVGENATDDARAFEVAARDPRPWSLVHPFYDTRLIQPLSLMVDDSNYNSSKVMIQAVETISFQQIIFQSVPRDEVINTKASLDIQLDNSYTQGIVQPEVSDVRELQNQVGIFDKIFEPIFLTSETLSEFKVLAGAATSNASELINNASRAIRSVTDFINYPAIVAQSLQSRVSAFEEAFNNFKVAIVNKNTLGEITQGDKNMYAVNAVNILSNISYASIVQPAITEDDDYQLTGDYFTRNDILIQIDLILRLYNELIETLDLLTTERADNVDSFFANPELMEQLDSLIVITVRNLETSIFDAVQERTIVLDNNTDIINLSYSLYGADIDDTKIDKLIETNSLSLNDNLEIRKGRSILYYT